MYLLIVWIKAYWMCYAVKEGTQMEYLKIRSKDNINFKGKPKVFFSCHPDDFEKSFNKICLDIFKTHDCAIYYTENMATEFEDENWELDLNQMNLFVVPVSNKLLCTNNRTMITDFPFAKKNHIPVLPIMIELGIEEIYSKEDKFGELQYLSPYEFDVTAISYEDKLKKYLDSVLVSGEIAARIRSTFDAYVFLSYRKKDRFFANELMRTIHSNPLCQNIAIWYDEFLTPGESFKENIEKILDNSKLFALLVTPNLLEEPNGKPNFVMGNEYPKAKNHNMEIIPAEMVKTNIDLLKTKYDIPNCYHFDREDDKKRFIEVISKLAHMRCENHPEHEYLLGLAYLDGIDVEVNRELGIEMIKSAAELESPEAMRLTRNFYRDGSVIEKNIDQALYWANKLYEYYEMRYGENDINTLKEFKEIGQILLMYKDRKRLRKGLETFKILFTICSNNYGKDHPFTNEVLFWLSFAYSLNDFYKSALKHAKTVYKYYIKKYDKKDPRSVGTLIFIQNYYLKLFDCENAINIGKRVLPICKELFGEEHPLTIKSICTYAESKKLNDEDDDAIYLYRNALDIVSNMYGLDHPYIAKIWNEIAFICIRKDDLDTVLDLYKKYNIKDNQIINQSFDY